MVTILDVAREARTSPSTVSHVINGTRNVAPETRQRVEEAVSKLRYRRDGIARSLRRSRSGTIGLIIADITSPFLAEIVRGVEHAVADWNGRYNVILCDTDGEPDRERAMIELLLEKRVDGIILCPLGGNEELLNEIVADGLPLVFVDRQVPGVGADTVGVDNRGAAFAAVSHLLGLGYGSIAALGFGTDFNTINDRLAGYADALRTAGRPVADEDIIHAAPTLAGGIEAGLRLLDRPVPPRAVFCTNEYMAIGMMRAMAERGRRCPEEVAIVTFDDFPWSPAFRPRLTVVWQPSYRMGRVAADLLLQRMTEGRDRPPQCRVLPTELRIRESCGTGLVAASLPQAAAAE